MSEPFENILNAETIETDYNTRFAIGLCGIRRVGKSTTAKFLKKKFGVSNITAVIVSFGDAVKQEVSEAYDFDIAYCYDDDLKDTKVITFVMPEGDPRIPDTAVKVDDNTYEATVRELMQWYATDYRRAQDPDYWTKKTIAAAEYQLISNQVVIFDDIRFPNEVEAIKVFPRNLFIKLHPHEKYVSTSANGHFSETALKNYNIELEVTPKFGKFYLQLLANDIFKTPEVGEFLKN